MSDAPARWTRSQGRKRGKPTAAEAPPPIEALWRKQLIVSDTGKPRALLANAITALRGAPEWQGVIGFDEFARRLVFRDRAPWASSLAAAGDEWTNAHDVLCADWLQHHGIHVSPEIAASAVDVTAREHTFHPIRDFLDGLRWDGEHRLDLWATSYLGAEDTPYTQAVAARWMISAVARVMAPGCKADCALILEGPQGTLKSSALKVLAQPWFADEIADLGTKDASIQLAGTWVLELAELDSMSRGEVSKIKAFMSRTIDRFRPPYGRRVIEVPRQCVFAGTVNLTEYLRDETGGRRFWPIACGTIDVDGLADARNQLWAEARDRYLAEERWWLDTRELTQEAKAEQQARYEPDPWEVPIREWLGLRDKVTVGETIQVLKSVLNIPLEQQDQKSMNRVSRCLRSLGWTRKQERVDGGDKRVWVYVSPVSPDEAQ